jgi:phosphoglycolate phosphatase
MSTLQETQAVYIGDSTFDIEACRACCVPVIAVGYGFGTEQDLRNAAPDYYAHSVNDLQVCVANIITG